MFAHLRGGSRDQKKIEAFFAKYATDDKISEAGTEKLCEHLGFSPLDPVALVLCWHCGAKQMGTFTKQEFIKGMESLGASSAEELKGKVSDMRGALSPKHPDAKSVYTYVFQLSLDP